MHCHAQLVQHIGEKREDGCSWAALPPAGTGHSQCSLQVWHSSGFLLTYYSLTDYRGHGPVMPQRGTRTGFQAW